jgi:hypothetical protein
MIEIDCEPTFDTSVRIDALPAFFQTGLQVRDAMTKNQFVVTPETPVLTVAQVMVA